MVLASEEKLTERLTVADGAAQRLLQGLIQKYNYVIADVPLTQMVWHGELLDLARQRVLVMEPTLQAVRDMLRMLALPPGTQQIRQPLIVLNKLGALGTMTRQEVEAALQRKIDVVIPYLPRVINQAAMLGTPAAAHTSFGPAIRDLARGIAALSGVNGTRGRLARLLGRRAVR